jgi:hypothetical protein
VNARKAYGEIDVYLYAFLSLELEGGESTSFTSIFSPREEPRHYWAGGWMDPHIGMEASENRINILSFLGIEAQLLGRHPVAKSQRRLWCTGSQLNTN